MDIQETKELSFDTQDFPKEVWVFDADNLDQGTEISHLMMSHTEEYTKDELLVICRKASMVIDQLRTDLAKAQAVPEWIETAIQPPEEGQKVIISGIYGVGIAEFSYLYKDEFVMYDMGASNPILSKDQVKFWQPLPDAPQEPAND